MAEILSAVAITIRPAVSKDADGIARTFLQSAEYHATLDPERYAAPAFETISARYQQEWHHLPDTGRERVTLVAELRGEIVGFVDADSNSRPIQCTER